MRPPGGHEKLRGVRDIHHAVLCHGKHTDLSRRAEPEEGWREGRRERRTVRRIREQRSRERSGERRKKRMRRIEVKEKDVIGYLYNSKKRPFIDTISPFLRLSLPLN